MKVIYERFIHLSNRVFLLLFEAEVLPEAADGGLDTRTVLIVV